MVTKILSLDIRDYEFVHHTWKNVTALNCEMQTSHLLEVILFSQKDRLENSRWLCCVTTIEFRASNITESVKSDHLLHWNTLPVLFATIYRIIPTLCWHSAHVSNSEPLWLKLNNLLIIDEILRQLYQIHAEWNSIKISQTTPYSQTCTIGTV